MAELMAHGKSGFLVRNVPEAVEALKVVKDLDPFFCRAYAMEKFSIHKMLSEYIQVYEDIAR